MKTAILKIIAIIMITTVIGCSDTPKTKGSE